MFMSRRTIAHPLSFSGNYESNKEANLYFLPSVHFAGEIERSKLKTKMVIVPPFS